MEESKMAPDEAVNIEGEWGREQNAWLMNIKIDLYSAAVGDEREMNPELKGETCCRKDELQEKTDKCNKRKKWKQEKGMTKGKIRTWSKRWIVEDQDDHEKVVKVNPSVHLIHHYDGLSLSQFKWVWGHSVHGTVAQI